MSSSAVGAVHLLTLGEVRVRPKNIAGTGTPMLWWTLTSRRWSDWLPVHAAFVEHERGAVLFDTGQAPASLSEPDYYPGGLLGLVYRRQAQFRVAPEQTLEAELGRLGRSRSDVARVALSHLHQDHAGNVALLPGIPVLTSPADLALFDEAQPEMHGVLARHLRAEGVDYRAVEYVERPEPFLAPFEGRAADVHGDGSLLLLETPGHSPGSQSLLVLGPESPVLLLGDVSYAPALLARGIVPDTGARAVQLETARRITALAALLPGLRLVAAHDPHAAARLAGSLA